MVVINRWPGPSRFVSLSTQDDVRFVHKPDRIRDGRVEQYGGAGAHFDFEGALAPRIT